MFFCSFSVFNLLSQTYISHFFHHSTQSWNTLGLGACISALSRICIAVTGLHCFRRNKEIKSMRKETHLWLSRNNSKLKLSEIYIRKVGSNMLAQLCYSARSIIINSTQHVGVANPSKLFFRNNNTLFCLRVDHTCARPFWTILAKNVIHVEWYIYSSIFSLLLRKTMQRQTLFERNFEYIYIYIYIYIYR